MNQSPDDDEIEQQREANDLSPASPETGRTADRSPNLMLKSVSVAQTTVWHYLS